MENLLIRLQIMREDIEWRGIAALIVAGPFFLWVGLGLIWFGPHFDSPAVGPVWFQELRDIGGRMFGFGAVPLVVLFKVCDWIEKRRR